MSNVSTVLHDGNYYLLHEHLSGNHHVYAIRMCKLLPNEITLRNGRFHRFARGGQDYKTYLRRKIVSEDVMQEMMNGILEWIAVHINHCWTFSVRMHNVHDATLTFEFADTSDAVLFALSWS